MPHTVNGIGTGYYGRKNASTVVGTCEHCGRHATLSSYDTRECVCVVFIPIIPLKKYRILNDCAACRQHRRVPWATFQEAVNTNIDPLRQRVAVNPKDANAQLALLQGLMQLELWNDADQAARAAAAVLPEEGELNRLAGEIALCRGDPSGATPYLRRAAARGPADPRARLSLGRHLRNIGEDADAVRELEEARRLDPRTWEAPYHLGHVYLKTSRWGEALACFEDVVRLKPELAADPDFLASTRTCKTALGYPLSEAERKSQRWWWPFGQRRRGRPAAEGISWRRLGVILGVFVVAGAVAVIGVGYWRQNHVAVYFDNGLSTPVTVAVDGVPFPLPAGRREQRVLRPGVHPVVVSGAEGEIERLDARIDALPLLDAAISSRFFVYDVSEARIYSRGTVVYSERASGQASSSELVAFQRFFPQMDVDYVFEPPPRSISSSATGAERRIAFDVAHGLDYNGLANIRYGEGKIGEAERALRKALTLNPCHAGARRNAIELLRLGGQSQKAVTEARAWMTACPAAGLEGHRAYQDAMLDLDRRDELLREYSARRQEHPDEAASHYLLGRVMTDPLLALPKQREALRLDPKLFWAHVALAYDFLALEGYPEAAAELQQALTLPGRDMSIAVPYAMAAIGAGQAEAAARSLAAATGREADDPGVGQARFLLALARRDWKAAEALVRGRAAGRGGTEANFEEEVKLLRQQERYDQLTKRLDAAGRNKNLALRVTMIRFERMIEERQYHEAAALFDSALASGEEASLLHQLCAAAGLMMAGDAAAARASLAAVSAGAGRAHPDTRRRALTAMVGALDGTLPADRVLAAARADDFQTLKFAYFLLGSRAASRGEQASASGFFEKSARAAVDLEFPLAAARKLAAR